MPRLAASTPDTSPFTSPAGFGRDPYVRVDTSGGCGSIRAPTRGIRAAAPDSLKLFTPRRFDSLPGMDFSGDPDTSPGRDEIVSYLDRYAERFDLTLRLSTSARALRHAVDAFGERRRSGLFSIKRRDVAGERQTAVVVRRRTPGPVGATDGRHALAPRELAAQHGVGDLRPDR
jgi:hypothetical protein